MPGAFCWFELVTTDHGAAKSFYSALFGWTPSDLPVGPDGSYTIFRRGDRDTAAAYAMPAEYRAQGMPPNWLLYVMVENADASAARASELGGSIAVEPLDVMDQGRMAVIADPLGARLALWQPKQHGGVSTYGEIGAIGWADLQVRDQVRAADFYSALFGWKMVEGKTMKPANPGDYYHIVNGSDMIGGIPPAEHVDPHAPPAWLMYVEVTDCAASTRQAVTLGGRSYVDTMAIGENGRISVIADPQGAVFALHESARPTGR
jgi:predicted enzyme related to lactoylglutathione lyase